MQLFVTAPGSLGVPILCNALLKPVAGLVGSSAPAATAYPSGSSTFCTTSCDRCEHAVPLIWRFHAVHHLDPASEKWVASRLFVVTARRISSGSANSDVPGQLERNTPAFDHSAVDVAPLDVKKPAAVCGLIESDRAASRGRVRVTTSGRTSWSAAVDLPTGMPAARSSDSSLAAMTLPRSSGAAQTVERCRRGPRLDAVRPERVKTRRAAR